MRKVDKDRVARLDEILGEVFHQDGHFSRVERKGECLVEAHGKCFHNGHAI